MQKRLDERRRLQRIIPVVRSSRSEHGQSNRHRKPVGRQMRQCRFEQCEPRFVLTASATPTGVLPIATPLEYDATQAALVGNSLDWQNGAWGVKVTGQGSPGSPQVRVDLPGGTHDMGNSLEVYYAFSAADVSQISVFLTDGFWRQVSHGGPWGTSFRLFRYYASNDQVRDNSIANHFQVVGVNPDGKLRVLLDYDNDSTAGDKFNVHADVLLEPPGQSETAMIASITVTNASGRDVTPFWDGHRQLAEQWELFGLSSMYVADNLTGGLPDWYDGLDPAHRYVGITNDGDYLNDGFSVNGQVYVPTHDVKRLVAGSAVVNLAHDEAACPHVVVPGYEWYDQLVLLDQPATQVSLVHLYESSRNQRVQVLAASGITSTLSDLKWAATYNRTDTNMVDGDNVQMKLGMDDVLNVWAKGASQTVQLRLTAGQTDLAATGSYFHTAGRDIVSDATGQNVSFRGVNVPGLEYGSFFANPYPGTLGNDYFSPRAQDFDVLRNLGFNVARIPFEWARLVPGWQSGSPLPTSLDAGYLATLDTAVEMASARGLYVVLDMHDFLKYWSGPSAYVGVNTSPEDQQLLARTWQLLAAHYVDQPAILGFDLMNEPLREEAGSSNWHAIAQMVVDAIRQADTRHLIIVEGPNYSLASDWPVDNPVPPITDPVSPSRIVYSPHVYFDYNNDSRYDEPGEATGPLGAWQYYVRDRLLPVIDWSVKYSVPLFFGETGVPSTTQWAGVMEHAFASFLEPLHLSTAAWYYIDPAHSPNDPLNLAIPAGAGTLEVLAAFPGGVYQQTGDLVLTPSDSLVYDDSRVNPWHLGDGFWGQVAVDQAATDVIHTGTHSFSAQFLSSYSGVKFVHQFGLDTSRFTQLTFWIYATSSDLDFRIFTTGPLPNSGEYPASFEDRPKLTDYLTEPLVAGQWQQVMVPLSDVVAPDNRVITGIALQNDSRANQPRFYLDDVRLVAIDANPVVQTPSGPGENRFTLRRHGELVELVDSRTSEQLFSQPLNTIHSLTIVGVDGKSDALTVDLAFGGNFTLSGGVAFDGRLGRSADAVSVLGTSGDDTLELSSGGIIANGLHITASRIESIMLIGGDGNDVYKLTAAAVPVKITDSGGIDELDFSGASGGVAVNLALGLGQRQSIRPWRQTLALSGSVESVIGTAFADTIRGNSAANLIFGVGGNDSLYGGSGNDILIGGQGNDQLDGGPGNDLLIGGQGRDWLYGQSGSDLLIGGTTDFDSSEAALLTVLAEWTTAQPLSVRIDHLTNGGGLSGSIVLNQGSTLHGDGTRDYLFGGPGSDWFLRLDTDVARDRGRGDG